MHSKLFIMLIIGTTQIFIYKLIINLIDPMQIADPLIYTEKIKKEKYMHQLFCWIESGNTQKVIQFYETYPQFVNKFLSANNWTPAMYAARYGNFELLKYFIQNGHSPDVPNIYNNTLVHAACYSNDAKMLIYVLRDLKRDPNPVNSDPSPLKYCIKSNQPRLIELLVNHGSYYVFGDILNNLEKVERTNQKDEKEITYTSLLNRKQIFPATVVKDSDLKEYPIKESLRWARAKSLLYMKKHAESSVSMKFQPLRRILNNERLFDSITRLCVGNGSSLKIPESNAQQQEESAMNIEKN